MNPRSSWTLLLTAAVLVVAVLFFLLFFTVRDRRPIEIAAGQATGEAFEMARAIAQIANRYEPSLKIKVRETAGSVENVELLKRGKVALATVQADAPTWQSARLLAVLYPDEFQLVVRADSGIRHFSQLRGRRVALPPERGGQYRSFWFLARHYGFSESDIESIVLATEKANEALLAGAVDAVFRVRAPRSATLLRLFLTDDVRLVPIEQGKALRLQNPAIDWGLIPRGAYHGDPPMPPEDVETVSVPRLLLAHQRLRAARVHALTRLLFERRQDLLAITPLAAHISAPVRSSGTFMPIHRGAKRYYERGEPTFWQKNVEIFAFLLSAAGLLGSLLWALKSFLDRQQKSRADRYNRQIIEMGKEIIEAGDQKTVREHRRQLLKILEQVVRDLDEDRVSPEGFQYFSFTWEAVHWLASDREGELASGVEEPASIAALDRPQSSASSS